MKYWHFNSAFCKAKIIRECPNITKFVRGWSKGGLDSLAWQYASSGCELLNDRKDFLWYVWKETHPKNRCFEMVPPSPFLKTPPPSFNPVKWSWGVRFAGNLESIKNQIANFSQHCVVACSVFFFKWAKKWNPSLRFGGRHKFFMCPKLSWKKIT